MTEEVVLWIGACLVVLGAVGVIAFVSGRVSERRSSALNQDPSDTVANATILILCFMGVLSLMSFFKAPVQWDFIEHVLTLLDRALFICLGYLIRDKQDQVHAVIPTPAVVAPVVVAIPPEQEGAH